MRGNARKSPRKNSYSRSEMAADPRDQAAQEAHDETVEAFDKAQEVAHSVNAGSWRGERKTVYVWDVPGERGYTLHIEIREADSVETARGRAVEYEPEGRELSAVERQWVMSTDPLVVRATETVTLGHDAALHDNERLYDENTAYRATRKLFSSLGIDPNSPQAWVDSVHAAAEQRIREAQTEADYRYRKMADALVAFRSSLDSLIEATGFAPPKPVPPPRPDSSVLTVYYDEEHVSPVNYPDLVHANWVSVPPGEPLTTEEVFGFRLLLGIDCAGVLDNVQRRASMREAAALRAVGSRIRAQVQAEIASRKVS